MTTNEVSESDLLRELEPVVEGELNRHLKVAKEWFPHEYVPWSEGRNFDGLLGGDPWSPDDADMPDVARTALIVNLLTEDNLPSYHHEIAVLFGRDNAGATGCTAGRPRRAGTASRCATTCWSSGWSTRSRWSGSGWSTCRRATRRLARRGRASLAGLRLVPGAGHPRLAPQHRPVHRRPDVRPAARPDRADENLHMIFYRNLLKAALELAPDQTMAAIRDVVTSFEMPGAGIPASSARPSRWRSRASTTCASTTTTSSMPVLRFWDVFDLEGLTGEGEQARSELRTS